MLIKIKDLALKVIGISPFFMGIICGYILRTPIRISLGILLDMVKLIK